MSNALIVLIPKPHKDHLLCESYRSLINSDVKILAKVLAKLLNTVITTIIGANQTGFMPGRSTSINLRRLFTNLQAAHDTTGSRAVLALDAHKAFNSVEWPYLFEVLAKFGFGTTFIKWLQLLYFKPIARLRVNASIS